MKTIYRIVGYSVQGGAYDIIRDFENTVGAYGQIGEMVKDLSHWKKIEFKIFDGFDKVYDSTVWKHPFERFPEDIIPEEVQ